MGVAAVDLGHARVSTADQGTAIGTGRICATLRGYTPSSQISWIRYDVWFSKVRRSQAVAALAVNRKKSFTKPRQGIAFGADFRELTPIPSVAGAAPVLPLKGNGFGLRFARHESLEHLPERG